MVLAAFASGPGPMARQAIEHAAIEIAPAADQWYGLRQGRLADPFCHHWLDRTAASR